MSVARTPKDVVLAYVDAFNRGDLDGLCALFTPDALVWGVLGWGEIEKVRPIWKDLIECLGMQLQVDALIAEGDVVAVRYTERGTSRLAFRGQGPTGRSYELTAMEWFEIRDGRIRRRWGARDGASQMRQLGFTQD
ncbi:MAG: nuclear transport factor 2 family protein [Planctomycetes bacterium]|nr:nuclear transport factor 2 family protein [Planctomycetota bacterium]